MTAPPQFRLEDKNLHHSSGYTTQGVEALLLPGKQRLITLVALGR